MTQDTLLSFYLPAVNRKKVTADLWRADLVGRRLGPVARGGTPVRSGRGAGGLHSGVARGGAGGPHSPGDAALPHVRGHVRIRGRRRLRRPAHGSPVQAGRGPGTGEWPRAVFATDHEPSGERALAHRDGAHDRRRWSISSPAPSRPLPPPSPSTSTIPTIRCAARQQLPLFHAHYDTRCFLPVHVYHVESGKPVAVLLRPGKTPSGVEVRTLLKHLVRRIRRHWPRTRLTFRRDSHYGRTQAMAWCEENRVDYIFGLECATTCCTASHTMSPTTSRCSAPRLARSW